MIIWTAFSKWVFVVFFISQCIILLKHERQLGRSSLLEGIEIEIWKKASGTGHAGPGSLATDER